MGRKQESSFGVVARTGVTLLALGFGSALFGALVVGPMLGKQLGPEAKRSPVPSASSVQLASSVLNDHAASSDDSSRETRAAEPAHEAAETRVETKPEDTSAFVEGTGAETVTLNQGGSYTGPTEDPDATSADLDPGTDAEKKPATPKPENSKPEESDHPKARTTPEAAPVRHSARLGDEQPEREATERSVRRTEEPRRTAREREAKTTEAASEREPRRPERSRPAEDEPRDRKSERRLVNNDERRPRRERDADEATHHRSTPREERRTETARRGEKPEKVEKTRTAAASETEADSEATTEKLYRVRVGRVHPREEAEKLRDELKDATGVDAFLVPVGDGFQIQTGAYKLRANAEKVAATLRAGNYRTVVQQDR